MSTLSGEVRKVLRDLRPSRLIAQYKFYKTKRDYRGEVEGPRPFWPIPQLLLRGRFIAVGITLWWRVKSALAVIITGEELH